MKQPRLKWSGLQLQQWFRTFENRILKSSVFERSEFEPHYLYKITRFTNFIERVLQCDYLDKIDADDEKILILSELEKLNSDQNDSRIVESSDEEKEKDDDDDCESIDLVSAKGTLSGSVEKSFLYVGY